MKNVEIKAKIDDPHGLISKVKALSKTEGVIIKQLDTFFKASQGRLKLRRFEDGSGELIYYERPDVIGPKLSDYKKTSVSAENYEDLKEILSISNGVIGTVKKTRYLYMIGQTRIHIDEVDGLGDFLEFEVVLNDKQTAENGETIARALMKDLGIQEKNLISEAYVDILQKKEQNITCN